jgi:hypothetical protein
LGEPGERGRLVSAPLRLATEPLATRDIALEMLVSRALDKGDKRLLALMVKRVGVRLRGCRDNGLVRDTLGPGQFNLWVIAR